MGYVYIFTNPCLVGWVKIGRTDNIKERLESLSTPSNIPFSFRAYATYQVDDDEKVEDGIHKIIDTIDPELRAREQRKKGKYRKKEFFTMLPEDAYAVFEQLARLRGDLDRLEKIISSEEERAEEEIEEKLVEKARRVRRRNFTFKELNIPVNEELAFFYDPEKKCKVIDEGNKVEFEGATRTLSELANILMGTTGSDGPSYFTYEGETVKERRIRIDQEKEREMDE